MSSDADDPRIAAGVAMLGRTGASSFQLRYHVVWLAVGEWQRSGGSYFDAAAGMTPAAAVLRLCERVIDGGKCTHCGKPTMFHADLDDAPTVLDELFCAYEWDPELSTFRRSCE